MAKDRRREGENGREKERGNRKEGKKGKKEQRGRD